MVLHVTAARAAAIGVRELHNHTSEVMRRVAGGESIEVTSHGKPVARLVPVAGNDPLEDLRRRGLITDPAGGDWTPDTRVKPSGPVSDLVSEQRD